MKNIVLSIVFAVSILVVEGQTYTGNLYCETQAQVDQFLIDYPTVTYFDGFLYVQCNVDSGDPITNLDAFSNLTYVEFLKVERCPGIPFSLAGLSTLNEVYSVYFEGFYDFSGLENLTTCNTLSIRYLNFANEPNLVLSTFDNLTALNTLNLEITDETNYLSNVFPELTSLNGLYMGNNSDATDDFRVAGLTGFNQVESLDYFTLGGSGLENEPHPHIGDFSILNNVTLVASFRLEGLTCDTYDSFGSLEQTGLIFLYVEGQDIYFDNLTSAGQIQLRAPEILPGSYHLDHITNCNSLTVLNNSGADFFSLSANELTNVQWTLYIEGGNADDYSNIQFPVLQHTGGLWFFDTNATSMDFLSGLISIDGDITISQNTQLTDCDISALCERIGTSLEQIVIQLNSSGCNNFDEVLSDCNLSFVSGQVYADMDCDGIFNNDDVVIQNPIMLNETGNPIIQNTSGGQYYIWLQSNTTTDFSPIVAAPFLPAALATITTNGTYQSFLNQDFPLCIGDYSYHDISVTCLSERPRLGFDVSYNFMVQNNGAHLEDAILTFDFSLMPGASFVSADYPATVGNNTISFDLTGMAYFSQRIVTVVMHISSSTALGTLYHPSAHVELLNNTDNDLLNNDYLWRETVVGSFDPNDIAVNIEAQNIVDVPAEGLTLDYTVRFQNTGTAAAEFVRVRSTIEDDFQLGTIEMLNASHPYLLSFNENREVEWLFEDIQLPDSTSDEAGSHGFIQYRIRTRPDVTIDDAIENVAAIYFDYNAPVITNTATTVFYVCPEAMIIESEPIVCEGTTVNAIATYGWENYSWTVNDVVNGTGLGITLDNPAAGVYVLECNAQTEYCESLATYEILVNNKPDTPAISQSGNVLTATGSGLFHWTLNGQDLTDMDNSIEMTESGIYAVTSTSNGCTSDIAEGNYVYTKVDETFSSNVFTLSPNPAIENFQLRLGENFVGNLKITIINTLGEVVMMERISSPVTNVSAENLLSGVYYVSVKNDGRQVGDVLKLIVQK